MKRGERVIFRVRWSGTASYWDLSGPQGFISQHDPKTEAVREGAMYCRSMRKSEGTCSELIVHNKNGRIADKRTYGRDPRRSKG